MHQVKLQLKLWVGFCSWFSQKPLLGFPMCNITAVARKLLDELLNTLYACFRINNARTRSHMMIKQAVI